MMGTKKKGKETVGISSTGMTIAPGYGRRRTAVLFRGNCLDLLRDMPNDAVDLTVTSPPYCIGKQYERTKSVADFEELHRQVIPEVVRVTKPGGSICWQVGYHIRRNGHVTPLDLVVHPLFAAHGSLVFRNRIIWTYGHGLHCANRFSGRHEVILWFTKGDKYTFNLDAVRVPQKYPGKRHYKGENKGSYSGNPKGKNPDDVWNIPNLKARHVERTTHPCQFPIGLAQRLIRALSSSGDVVFDPFAGSGTTGAAAIMEGRRFVGAEILRNYYRLAHKRMLAAASGSLVFRNGDSPVYEPTGRRSVEKRPGHFGSF